MKTITFCAIFVAGLFVSENILAQEVKEICHCENKEVSCRYDDEQISRILGKDKRNICEICCEKEIDDGLRDFVIRDDLVGV
jgi:hypothetical protein